MNAIIRVIARPSICWEGVQGLLDSIGDQWSRSHGATEAEELVELSGRMCYLSFGSRQSPRSNRDYLRNVIDKGHESVLEHAVWTLEFSGVTRAFSHQLVRHRVGFSYSQLSQQYVDHENFEVLRPVDLTRYPDAAAAWEKAEDAVRSAYIELHRALDIESEGSSFESDRERRRFINSVARQVLPNAVSTRVMVTANARALRHFLALRGGIEGDREMREVSTVLLRVMSREAPVLFEDFEEVKLADGEPAVLLRAGGDTVIQPWSKIVDSYERYAGDRPSMRAMTRLSRFISQTHLARGLFAWTSMHDLCIVQTEVTYPYHGPRLVVSPKGDDQVEFQYVGALDKSKQLHRDVACDQAVPSLLEVLNQLRWFPAEVLESLDHEAL